MLHDPIAVWGLDSAVFSRRVRSLADVLKINASVFLGAMDVLVQYHFVGQLQSNDAGHPDARASLREQIAGLLSEMGDPSFAMCKVSAERMIANIDQGAPVPQLVRDAFDLQGRLHDHFRSNFVLALSDADKRRFEPDQPLFGLDVDVRFPSASTDISEAGKCLALSRDTAAVFHLMRVMEVGVLAVARGLGIPDPVKPAQRNWGAVLAKIKAEMDRRSQAGQWLDRAFFDEAYVSLDAVRSAWRNSTMHVDAVYPKDKAEDIFAAVRRFMVTLASRLDEDGQPPA